MKTVKSPKQVPIKNKKEGKNSKQAKTENKTNQPKPQNKPKTKKPTTFLLKWYFLDIYLKACEKQYWHRVFFFSGVLAYDTVQEKQSEWQVRNW